MDENTLFEKGTTVGTSKIIHEILEVPIICFDSTRCFQLQDASAASASWNNLTYQFPPWNSRACQASYIARNAKLPKVFRIRSDLRITPWCSTLGVHFKHVIVLKPPKKTNPYLTPTFPKITKKKFPIFLVSCVLLLYKAFCHLNFRHQHISVFNKW